MLPLHIPPSVAEITAVPTFMAVVSPRRLTVATLESDEDHFTWPVMSIELPFEYVPVAVNC